MRFLSALLKLLCYRIGEAEDAAYDSLDSFGDER